MYLLIVFGLLLFSFECVYQYGGYTQGFVSQGVSNIGCLALVSLCHIQTAGRIPCSNLLKQFSVKSTARCLVYGSGCFKGTTTTVCFFSLKLRSHTTSTTPMSDTPFPDLPLLDWWHPGQNLFLVHWSCWREHVLSNHPSEPTNKKNHQHSSSINLKVSSFLIQPLTIKLFLSQLNIPSRSPFTVYLNNITRNNKAMRIEAGLTGKSSLCMWFIVLEVSLQSHWRSRRAWRVIADTGGGGSARYYNGSFWKLPAMIPSTDWKSFVEQSKWLTLTRVKETHRGFDINTGGDMHGEKVGEREWNITKKHVVTVDNAVVT